MEFVARELSALEGLNLTIKYRFKHHFKYKIHLSIL